MKKVNLLFVIAVSASMFLVSCSGGETTAPKTSTTVEEATPETVVKEVEVVTEASTSNLTNGEAVYKKACFACHDTGAGGAAKLDDKESWITSANKGLATVNKNAIEGYTGEKGIMLAKGGSVSLTDQETIDAVAYMLNKAGVVAK